MLALQNQRTTSFPADLPRSAAAVLTSGGLKSAVLLAQALDHFDAVYPVYGRFGLPWQEAEEQYLKRFLAAIRGPRLGRLKVLDLPVGDIYSDDGTISAVLLPEQNSPSQSLKVPGRHVLLVSKAAVWSAVNGIEVFATGPLAHEIDPGTSESVFQQIESVVQLGLNQPIRVVHPFEELTTAEILSLGRDLPLDITFSCIRPVLNDGSWFHCGRCHKCSERQQAMSQLGINDRTRYLGEAAEGVSV